MDKLLSKFENIYFEHVMYKDDEAFKSVKIYAEETKKIAIEFAKKLMETKITMLRGMSDAPEIRNSPDYALMKGELIINGDKLFEQFIEEYYV